MSILKAKELVTFNNELYFIVISFREPETSEELSLIKENYLFDIVLRKNEFIFLCKKIENAEILQEWIYNENIINSVVEDFLQKKEIKKTEDIDNYILEVNNNPKVIYSPIILRKIFLDKLMENVNVPEQIT